jgi:hypothetical protein
LLIFQALEEDLVARFTVRSSGALMEFSSDVEMRRVSLEAQEFFEKVLYDEEPLFVSDEATLWARPASM